MPIMIRAEQSDPYLYRSILRALSRCKLRNTQGLKPGVMEAARAIVIMPGRSGKSINGRGKTFLNCVQVVVVLIETSFYVFRVYIAFPPLVSKEFHCNGVSQAYLINVSI